jgi:hypothetical protein
MMHGANPDRSDRLKRVLDVLRAHPHGISSINLQEQAQTVAPGTCVSELRRAGYHVRCEYLMRKLNGSKVYIYTLGEAP